MGLFSFFSRKNGTNGLDISHATTTHPKQPDIPENIFIEKDATQKETADDKLSSTSNEHGINVLFLFLEKNHEGKGYDDALINPDNTHLEQNVEALKNELERTIKKQKIFYQDFIREINFHITTRSRSGMVDTVEELTVKKETAENHIKQILEIENDLNNKYGIAQGVILSYTRGFRNGLAAISHHSIIKRSF